MLWAGGVPQQHPPVMNKSVLMAVLIHFGPKRLSLIAKLVSTTVYFPESDKGVAHGSVRVLKRAVCFARQPVPS